MLRSSFRRGSVPALPWYFPIGPTSCFYWASKLLRGTFSAGLKRLKCSAAASEGAPCLLCPGTTLGPTSCFYWASKLLRGTFWAGLTSLKWSTSLVAVSNYWSSKLLRGTFWAGFKSFKGSISLVSSATASEGAPCLLCPGTALGPTSCCYSASKLLHGKF